MQVEERNLCIVVEQVHVICSNQRVLADIVRGHVGREAQSTSAVLACSADNPLQQMTASAPGCTPQVDKPVVARPVRYGIECNHELGVSPRYEIIESRRRR